MLTGCLLTGGSVTAQWSRGQIRHFTMEDSIEMILQDVDRVLPKSRDHPILSACTGALLTGLYGIWTLFAMPGFRKIPCSLKQQMWAKKNLKMDKTTSCSRVNDHQLGSIFALQ
ncbi:hypothetical protein LDENG_00279050 [Lucifuga dentata]|nr:hypothetical protein LDENG_00279050 [Lucifuga dentata]